MGRGSAEDAEVELIQDRPELRISPSSAENNTWAPAGGELLDDDERGSEIAAEIESGYKIAYEYAHSERDHKLTHSDPEVTLILTRSDELLTYLEIKRMGERRPLGRLGLWTKREPLWTDRYLLYRGHKISEAISAGAEAIASVPQKGGTRGQWFPRLTGDSHPHVASQLRDVIARRAENRRKAWEKITRQTGSDPLDQTPISHD